ncbi:MAG: M48 family metalloprotease [Phycisphaeraceae bacterium]|nr:M48 family metalloprotease [Phycisphaerales bacterium]MCB9860794.1 M48 family metalloprotease [Phycisphaeraceae bacterium]
MPSLIVLLAIAPVLIGIEPPDSVFGYQPAAVAWWMVLGGSVCVTLVTGVLLARWTQALHHTGQAKYAMRADRFSHVAQIALLALHVAACLLLGWPEIVGAALGKPTGLTRLASLVPYFGCLVTLWWFVSGIQRRVIEMSLISRLDRGEPIASLPSRLALTWDRVRSQLVVTLGPIIVAYVLLRLADGYVGVQVALFAFIVLLSPMLITKLLPTVPLPAGQLRTMIEMLAQSQRVRVRSVRIWNTRGVMANAAVVGVLPPFRCVLLSDAVLNFMREKHIAAIILHECAHIRKWHPLWYLFSLLSVSWIGAWVFDSANTLLHNSERIAAYLHLLPEWWIFVPYAMLIVLTFGFVSRTFEREADALAVDALTKTPFVAEPDPEDARTPRERAISIMKATLLRTSQINGVSPDRRSFTHGSIVKRGIWLNKLKNADIGKGKAFTNARLLRLGVLMLMICAGLILVLDHQAWLELQQAFTEQ